MTLDNLNNVATSVLFVVSMFMLVVSIQVAVEIADINVKSYAFMCSLFLVYASFIPVQILAEIGNENMLFARIVRNFNVHFMIFYILFIFSLEGIFINRILRVRKKQIGKNSIKESMDNLPDGICFSKMDGTPLLVNRRMQELSYQVFGKRLVNDVMCERLIEEGKIKANATILQDNPIVIKSADKTWLIQVIYHDSIRETLAYDVSLEWALLGEIKKKNKEINDANLRLKDYQKKVGEYTRKKEILEAKISIHDKIGQSLIYFKHYLEKKNNSVEERNKLIKLWTESLLILDENKEEPNNSSWEKLLSTAESIGVNIHVSGELPSYERDRNVLVGIVHEALNNAIRHGEAKNVWISLVEDQIKIYCDISNDGVVKSTAIKERGGLKNIRERLKLYGGEMQIVKEPRFSLQISWIKGEDYDI